MINTEPSSFKTRCCFVMQNLRYIPNENNIFVFVEKEILFKKSLHSHKLLLGVVRIDRVTCSFVFEVVNGRGVTLNGKRYKHMNADLQGLS